MRSRGLESFVGANTAASGDRRDGTWTGNTVGAHDGASAGAPVWAPVVRDVLGGEVPEVGPC